MSEEEMCLTDEQISKVERLGKKVYAARKALADVWIEQKIYLDELFQAEPTQPDNSLETLFAVGHAFDATQEVVLRCAKYVEN